MGKIFGTDGVRGVANTELTCEQAMQIGRAAAYLLTKHHSGKPIILIGRDTRISSKMLECALIAGICSVGADATSIGIIPTPAVAYLVQKYRADAGIMISASHNPVEFNGIKIFQNNGYKLPDAMEEEIERLILNDLASIPLKTGIELGRAFTRRSAVNDYLQHLLSSIDGDLSGMRVAIDCANGSASATAEQLFKQLQAQVFILHAQPDGTNINQHCGSTHIEDLQQFVRSHRCSCGLAFDGDADRCLAVDENGKLIDGDQMIAIFAKSLQNQGRLAQNTAVVTVMTNLGFFHFAEKNQIRAEITQVGDRYVLEKMLEKGYQLGGEQSGHIILKDFATTGDGQLSAIQLLSILKKEDVPLSVLASCMDRFPQVLHNIDANAAQKQSFIEDKELQESIRQKNQKLGKNGRILVRPSGTEAIIRIMVEGKDLQQIEQIAKEIAEEIIKKRG